MARSHARLKVSIHRDGDWLQRTPEAKLTYYTLLSDPRLTIAGVMELAERRWGRMTGYEMPTLTAALVELEQHGYIVVDSDTDELLIRTLAKHDLDPGRLNKNIGKGFWGAWGVVESPILRSVIVHGLDDVLWAGLEELAPPDAEQTRRSTRLEPQSHFRLEPQTVVRSEPPLSSHRSPVTSRQPDQQPAEQRRTALEAAAAIIGQRAGARPTSGNPGAVARSVAAAVVRDRYEDAYRFLADDPSLTPDELAELLEPSKQTNGVHLGHTPEPNTNRLELRPVTDVISYENVDPEVGVEGIASIREANTFLARQRGA